jgi:zinc transport system ATP-binding protein
MSTAIEIHGLSFDYSGVPILKHIDLEVPEGEFIGLVGPNGGGKSTLLKIILGLLTPSAGRVCVLGKSPEAARQRIGYVPQYPPFPRDFPISVEDTVLLGRTRRLGPLTRDDREAASRAMNEARVANLRQRPIASLSGGQLQRTLVARALVSDPELLLLDEPTANIDLRGEEEIFDLLRQLNERMTIVVVSHDIAFISEYVERVACLNRTLVCHRTEAIDSETIQELYGPHIQMIPHQH